MFTLEVTIDGDTFKFSGNDDFFAAVLLQLDRWYAERKPVPEVLHGTIEFGSPTDQPIP